MKSYTLDDFTKLSAFREKKREEYFRASTKLGRLYLLGELTELERSERNYFELFRSTVITDLENLGFSIDWLEMTEDEFSEAITKQMEV